MRTVSRVSRTLARHGWRCALPKRPVAFLGVRGKERALPGLYICRGVTAVVPKRLLAWSRRHVYRGLKKAATSGGADGLENIDIVRSSGTASSALHSLASEIPLDGAGVLLGVGVPVVPPRYIAAPLLVFVAAPGWIVGDAHPPPLVRIAAVIDQLCDRVGDLLRFHGWGRPAVVNKACEQVVHLDCAKSAGRVMKNLCIPMITAQDVHEQCGKTELGGKGAQRRAGNRAARGGRGREAGAGRRGGLRPGRPLPWHAAGAGMFGDAAPVSAVAVRAAAGPLRGLVGRRRGIVGVGRLWRRARPGGRRCADRRPSRAAGGAGREA